MALLSVSDLQKRFPGVQALDGVDFELRAGEVHALMGENGAGKSTLIKVVTGVHARDGGEIKMGEQPIRPASPADAESLGISTVFQEINLIPRLSIAENILLGRQPRHATGAINWNALEQSARQALARLGVDLDVRKELATQSIAIQQVIAIARGIALDAKVLILDEPTSSLDEKEVDELFAVIERLKSQGMAIIFVTHFLDQVYRISDRITVLRNGRRVGTWGVQELGRLDLIEQMLGRNVPAHIERQNSVAKVGGQSGCVEPVVATRALARRGAVAPFDLEIFPGEVVGLAGLLGSGRTEIARLIAGVDSATAGSMEVDGRRVSGWSPRKAIDAGIVWCPEDRKRDGVIAPLSVRENIVLSLQAARSVFQPIGKAVQNEIAARYVSRLGIKTPSLETPVGALSGGNQQKVLLARALAMEPRLIVLDEPTRGIDVGAKAEIENLIASLREAGVAILLISSELEDLVRCCGRVVVLRDRKMVGTLDQHNLTEPTIMKMIARHDE